MNDKRAVWYVSSNEMFSISLTNFFCTQNEYLCNDNNVVVTISRNLKIWFANQSNYLIKMLMKYKISSKCAIKTLTTQNEMASFQSNDANWVIWKKKFQTKESRKKSSFNEKRMEKNIIAQWFVKNMELHFCLSKWKTESIVCALIYPNAHLSEKIEFLPCINNSTHYATHCKPKIRPFAVIGCELTDVRIFVATE